MCQKCSNAKSREAKEQEKAGTSPRSQTEGRIREQHGKEIQKAKDAMQSMFHSFPELANIRGDHHEDQQKPDLSTLKRLQGEAADPNRIRGGRLEWFLHTQNQLHHRTRPNILHSMQDQLHKPRWRKLPRMAVSCQLYWISLDKVQKLQWLVQDMATFNGVCMFQGSRAKVLGSCLLPASFAGPSSPCTACKTATFIIDRSQRCSHTVHLHVLDVSHLPAAQLSRALGLRAAVPTDIRTSLPVWYCADAKRH